MPQSDPAWVERWSANWWNWHCRDDKIPQHPDEDLPRLGEAWGERARIKLKSDWFPSYRIWYFWKHVDTWRLSNVPDSLLVDGLEQTICNYLWEPAYVYIELSALRQCEAHSWYKHLSFHSTSRPEYAVAVPADAAPGNFRMYWFLEENDHRYTCKEYYSANCMLRGVEMCFDGKSLGHVRGEDRPVNSRGYHGALQFVVTFHPDLLSDSAKQAIANHPPPITITTKDYPTCGKCRNPLVWTNFVRATPKRCTCLAQLWTSDLVLKVWDRESQIQVRSMIDAGLRLYRKWLTKQN